MYECEFISVPWRLFLGFECLIMKSLKLEMIFLLELHIENNAKQFHYYNILFTDNFVQKSHPVSLRTHHSELA